MKKSLPLALITAWTFNTQALADTVYITLEKDNALAVVDGANGRLTQTVKTWGIAVKS